MNQRTRIILALAGLVLLVAAVFGVEAVRSRDSEAKIPAGNIPIYVDGKLDGSFSPEDLEKLTLTSFIDPEEAKTQEGWLLRDVLRLYIPERKLKTGKHVVVSSGSRDKSVDLTWEQVDEPSNWVMFDLSGRGTLKLISVIAGFDTRDDWIQDVDRIELVQP